MTTPPPDCPPLPPDVPFTRLIGLPPRWRWEAVRRHPFYVWGWDRARRRREGRAAGAPLPLDGPADLEALKDFYANVGVARVGVTGEPVDPGADFHDLPEHFFPPQMGTAVYQPPARGLIAHLLLHLSDRDLAAVATLCRIAVDANREGGPGRGAAIDALAQFSGDAFDRPIDGPFFHVDPFERKGVVADEVERARGVYRERSPALADAVRAKASAEEKLAEQFRAWDLREGWADGEYDEAAEVGNRAAAVTIGDTSESTTSKDYQTAFGYIFGPPYTAGDRLALHCETRAYLLPPDRRTKYRERSGIKTDVDARRAERSGAQSGGGDAGLRLLADSQISKPGGGPSMVESRAIVMGAAEPTDEETERRTAVTRLVASGRDDTEIAQTLSTLIGQPVSEAMVERVREELDAGGGDEATALTL